jgi:hypothetical protein
VLPAEKVTVVDAVPPTVTGDGFDAVITRVATVMAVAPEAAE